MDYGGYTGYPGQTGLISAPQQLNADHTLTGFCCDYLALDDWLIRKAFKSKDKASQTFVVTDGTRVIGYYCLAAGSVMRKAVPGSLRRNMPDPIPVIVLGRLAVDNEFKGQNVGRGLLQDALLRANNVQQSIGARALIVHAIDPEAQRFYLRFGFREFPDDTLSLFMPLPWK